MAPQPVEDSVADMVRAVCAQCHRGHFPVCLTVWYADGLCSQIGMRCDPSRPEAWEPVVRHALRAGMARTGEQGPRPVCLTFWFSDGSYVQSGLPLLDRSAGAGADDLAQCKRDITTVIEAAGRRLATGEVLEKLQARNLLWGESTVKRALSQMRKAGELTNRSDVRPRGYGLPGWP